jgi:Mannosyltransferase putative
MPTSTAPLTTLITLPLTERNAQSIIDLVVQESADVKFNGIGTGYVICAGGRYAKYGYATCRWIREYLKEDAPIELWVGNNESIEPWMTTTEGITAHRADVPGGWPLKARAVRQSSFQKVILLDADCLPMVKASEVWSSPFMYLGALFFPDVANHRRSDWGYAALKLRPNEVGEAEAGQVLVDRVRHAKAVWLTDYFNQHPEFFYHHHHGDKDLWVLAFARLKSHYVWGNQCVGEEWGLRHYLPDGTWYSDHLIHVKNGQSYPNWLYQHYLEEFEKFYESPKSNES